MRRIWVAILAFGVTALAAWGQLSTGSVAGRVADPSGAVVVGAQVNLLDIATGAVKTAKTNSSGRYSFTGLPLGTYQLTVKANGFQTTTVQNIAVTVNHTATENVSLKVGASTQTVTVQSSPGTNLRMSNATVGTAFSNKLALLLPNQNRDVTSILLTQPMTEPAAGGAAGNTLAAGQVAGQMSDQNAYTLDGADATSDTEGNNAYVSFGAGGEAAIPTPVESIQEFRVSTNNMGASFSTSAGGEVALVTKRGGNKWHGSAYDFYQADELNAFGYGNNQTHHYACLNSNGVYDPTLTSCVLTQKQEMHRNRFGGSLGGVLFPKMLGGKTYFYFNYEGRRFPRQEEYSHSVPTASMRQGILEFPDDAGNIISYNLATSTQCAGPNGAGGQLCDPRGKGLNPAVSAIWNYMPLPDSHISSTGNGLNVATYTANLSLPISDNFAVMRVDHDFGPNWRMNGVYRFFKETAPTDNQVDIGGFYKGDTKGVPASLSSNPFQPRDLVVGLTGQITPMITNDFHFSYLRHWWSYQRGGWVPQVPGIPDALEIGGESQRGALIPVNLDTQNTRWRVWNGHDWGYRDDVGWMTGNHLIQFGGSITHYWIHHVRTDEVVGGVPSLVSQITSGALVMNGTYQPIECDPTNNLTTNCIASGNLGAWNGDYADVLGIVSSTNILVTRKGSNLTLQPFGTPVQDTDTYPYINLYANDVWHLSPSLTMNYGLTWAVEVAPTEINGNQTTLVDSSGHQIYMQQYLQNKLQAALQGQNYNPVVGFSPVGAIGLKAPYKTDWHQFGPRFALSWNPSLDSGLLSPLFGHHVAVLRGGYSRIYNRLAGVSLVMTPLLGPSFGQTISCAGPEMPGAGLKLCNGNSTLNPTNAFRIGIDGNTAPLPAISQTLTTPVEPGIGTTPASLFGFFLDPSYKPGYTDEWDISYQRTMPGHSLLEIGYVGNRARHLYQGIDLSAVPWMMRQGGQPFYQAFDNIMVQLNKGVSPASISNQPFFEAALGPTSAFCKGYNSCTQAVLSQVGTSPFTTDNVETVWSDLDSSWLFGPALPNTTQFPLSLYGEGPFGYSNYNAGFINYNIRANHGLTLDANLTYAHNLNTIGINQEYVLDTVENPWNIGTDYGPAYWDRKFTFNMLGLYNLPFGHGQNGVLNHLIGGWSVAPIWQWFSGDPIEMYAGSWGETGSSACCENGFTPIPLVSTKSFGSGTYNVTTGSPQATNTQCVACGGYGVNTGSGVNYFKNPVASFGAWRLPMVGIDGNSGGGGSFLRGLPHWNVNMTLAKTTNLSEGTRLQFTAQFFNIFNSMQRTDPFLDLQDPWDWGVEYGQWNSPRNIELGLRLYF